MTGHCRSDSASHRTVSQSFAEVFLCSLIVVFFAFFQSTVAAQGAASPVTSNVRPAALQATLVVGSEQDFPPFATGMTDASAGGFTVDLWKAVATEAGLDYALRVRPFHQLLQEFKEGKIDVLINLAMSDERHRFADFTVPHVTVHGAIFVRKGQSSIQSENDLATKSIIVLNADLAHDYAVSKGLAKQLVLVDTAADGLRLLASGRHDAMLLSKLAGLQTMQGLALSNITALPVKAGFSQKFAFATQHGRPDLLARLNEGLAITKANGVYNALYERWFGVYEKKEVGLRDVLVYVIPVVILFLLWAGYLFYRRQAERNLAALAIEESRDLLMAVIDTAPVRVFWKDREMRYLGCNTAFAHDAGMKNPEEMIGKDDFQMGWSAQAELYRTADQGVMVSGVAQLFYEEPQTTPDGETIWLRTSKVPLKTHNGEIVGVLGVYEDITEHKRDEESVRAASRYARSLIEASLDPLVTISSQGKITDVNSATERATGLDRGRLINSDFADYFTDPEKARSGYQQVFAQGFVADYPLAIRHTSGRVMDVLYNASVYRDGEGNVLGVFAAARDITQRKQAQDDLKESEAFKNAILNSVEAEIAVLDHEGFILAVNDPWRRFALENSTSHGEPHAFVEVGANYLATCDAVVGRESSEVRSTIDGIRAVLSGDLPNFSTEYPCHSPAEQRWFRMVVTPLGHGNNAGVVITHTNITDRVQSEQESAATLTHLQKIASRVPGMVYQYRLRPDGSSCFPFVSEAIQEIFRVGPEDVRHDASKVFARIHPDDRDAAVASIRKSAESLAPLNHEFRVKFDDGTVRWMLGSAVPERDVDDTTLWHGFITDITERIRSAEKLDLLMREQRAMLNNDLVGIVSVKDRKIVWANLAFEKMLGYAPGELAGTPTRQHYRTEQDYEKLGAAAYPVLTAGKLYRTQYEQVRKDGGIVWVDMSGEMLNKATGESLWAFVDITETKLMEDKVHQLAFQDTLTNLPNRRLLHDRLSQAMAATKRSGRYAAVMFLDLDNFKPLNDAHGHEVGDLLLIEAADRLTSCVREIDTVARFGGDEFVVMLSDLDSDREESIAQTMLVAEKIRSALSVPYQLTIRHSGLSDVHVTHHCTASIGATVFNGSDDNEDDILQWADAAMYLAKDAGRNTIRFHGTQP
ncbi:MAG TPA: PAS domain S-box protein [Rhodoferax sp.]|jgi:diguanylate cyclase (GGDEF)-like protein/PAS domain S-box-containing protein|nr:PAS domain S-box protein [Rhodoferax sp.]HPW28509.1 PAS domain S-box protein [Rhodoferax sp.]